jgi:hypothetical protein
MKRPSFVPLAVVTAGLALSLAACTGDPEPTPTVTVTETVDPSDTDGADADATAGPTVAPGAETGPLPDVGPDDQAPFVANTLPDTSATSSGALLSPADMRFGVHDGYDRLVIDLVGTGAPGWRAEYVDVPMGQASGLEVDIDGGAFIVITVQGMMYPGEDGAPDYEGPATIVPAPGGAIREVEFGTVFEGTLDIFVGVESEEPFRVFLLESPTRIVLDVQHP